MKKHIAVVPALVLLLVSLADFAVASAASPNISRSYDSSVSIPNGSLVSLVNANSSSVQVTNLANAQRLIGVAENSNQSLLAVDPVIGKVQVATDGTVNALVSTVNGNISVGQYVAVSPFNGVGMKASNGDRVIGTADTSFNSNTPGVVKEQVTDSQGQPRQLTVGYLKLTIAIGTLSTSHFSVQGLQQFVEGITGKPISTLRIIIGVVLALVAIVSIVTLIYASIYGSIVSIGRNPLAKLAVFRSLASVVGMVALVAVFASVAIYLILY